jgi:hypothetical protein
MFVLPGFKLDLGRLGNLEFETIINLKEVSASEVVVSCTLTAVHANVIIGSGMGLNDFG